MPKVLWLKDLEEVPRSWEYQQVNTITQLIRHNTYTCYLIVANYSSEVVDTLPNDMETGIYYGFANVDGGPVYKMVMSIGWNPFYKNVKKSMVTFKI